MQIRLINDRPRMRVTCTISAVPFARCENELHRFRCQRTHRRDVVTAVTLCGACRGHDVMVVPAWRPLAVKRGSFSGVGGMCGAPTRSGALRIGTGDT